MSTATRQTERDEALASLRDLLHPGDTVYTVLRNVARSGMSRRIDLYVFRDNHPRCISGLAARACGFTLRDGEISVSGGGMDMGFHLVYTLSRVLFADGFGCVGDRCPANDHVNGDRDYTPGHLHSDPGYALRQEWL